VAKSLDLIFSYPQSPEEIFEAGIETEYIEAKSEVLGHENLRILELSHGPEGGRGVIKYEISPDLPGWAQKVVPARTYVEETNTFDPLGADGARSYRVAVKFQAVPAIVSGRVLLRPDGAGGTRNEIRMEVRAQIPLIGGKLEDLVLRELRETIEGEAAFARTWFADS
jgi:hypothetical protein